MFVRLCLHSDEAYPLEHFRSGLLFKKISRYLSNCFTLGREMSLPRGMQSKKHFKGAVWKWKKMGYGLIEEKLNLRSKTLCFNAVILTFMRRTELSDTGSAGVQTTTFWAGVKPVQIVIHPGIWGNTNVGATHHQWGNREQKRDVSAERWYRFDDIWIFENTLLFKYW